MITIENVTFQYTKAKTSILSDFSITIKQNEAVGIIGPTGSGKSTICYLLNGLIPHYFKGNFSGNIIVNGLNILNETVERMSEIVGYMLQEPSFQIASPFVESEITFGMENFGASRVDMDIQLEKVIDLLNISHLRNRATSDLSEGEKQKVVLASILAMNPPILVLDESSSMVDSTSKIQLINILLDLNKSGKTIVLVDHDLDFLSQIANRIVLINKGEIVADGPTKDILGYSELLQENGLQPPALVSLFNKFRQQSIPVKQLPIGLEEAIKIAKDWLK
jgi:energy-coupling factor transporter ATP-binding protein EcfA2